MILLALHRIKYNSIMENENYFHHKVWDEITFAFSNFNGAAAEAWEWMNNVCVILVVLYWIKFNPDMEK